MLSFDRRRSSSPPPGLHAPSESPTASSTAVSKFTATEEAFFVERPVRAFKVALTWEWHRTVKDLCTSKYKCIFSGIPAIMASRVLVTHYLFC